ncbi:MAG TPA: S8 family serine peptidase [Candidatus Polarisedimenticolaceae bacterium]|nr:S8 family serine peptidase [Candidatus Polarisedimenticolaceae bacterium]
MTRRALALVVLLGAIVPALAVTPEDRVPEELVIQLAPGVYSGAVAQRYGLTVLDSIPEWWMHELRVVPGTNVDGLVAALRADPDVLGAEPHLLLDSPEGVQLSIPDLDESAGPEEYEGQTATTAIRLAEAQARYRGAGVIVAVLDTGVVQTHPRIASRLLRPGADFAGGDGTAGAQANGLDDDGDGMVDESREHGTFVAGLIQLVAPDALILPVRVLEEDGRGTSFGLAKGIAFAVQRGARVINLSLGMRQDSYLVARAIEYAHAAGIAVVAAAGNRALPEVDFPARLSRVIAVAASDGGGRRATFSNYGAQVALSAPGTGVLSTFGADGFARWSGTSFATPLVSGAVALLLERYPGLDASVVRTLLARTAQPDENPPELAGQMGAGLLDAGALLAALATDRNSLRLRQTGGGTVLSFSPVSGASQYDVARGGPKGLELESGRAEVDLGPLVCLANDAPAGDSGGVIDVDAPPVGALFFYLFRDDAQDPGGRNYGTANGGALRVAGATDCPVH